MVKVNDFNKPSGIGIDGSLESIGQVAVTIWPAHQASSEANFF
jgi:hypothetical protein